MRLRAEQRAFWEDMQLSNRDLSERRLQLAIQRFEQTAVSPKAKKKAQPANTKPEQRQEETTNRLPQSGQTSPISPLFRPRTAADFLAFATQLQEQQAQKQEKLNREKLDREERERGEMDREYPEQENLVLPWENHVAPHGQTGAAGRQSAVPQGSPQPVAPFTLANYQ
jgi:hypothetical protein